MPPEPAVFGYGSLVNRATHAYAPARPATLSGWRRAWGYTAHRAGPFLTAVPSPGDAIDGLIATVGAGDWAALDAREAGYDRLPTPWPGVVIYAVPRPRPAMPGDAPILLSYLDVVVQGFMREYGPEGVARFAATTDGWEAGILDDRAAPRYPRHQRLSPAETAATDALIAALGVPVRS